MGLWCNSCKCHVSSPCTSHHLPEDHRGSVCRRFRSTKGASKARRDHINHEIRNMRTLLPISQEDQEHLSYLHSMAAICTYIRKSVLFQGLPVGEISHSSVPYEAFLDALHGFMLVTTAQGRLVYVSENVAEYLGLSMVDVLQWDSVFDLVGRSDVGVVQSNLHVESNLSSERSFVCCMQTSKAFKLQHGSCCSMLVRGSFQFFPQSSPAASGTDEPLFVALCTPTVNRLTSANSPYCHSFSSTHRLDMSFTQLSDSVLFLLGYPVGELTGRSWYSLVHPEDLSLAASSHRSLMQADEGFQVEIVLRLQCADLSWTWIYIRANKDVECQSISCTNFITSETEAKFLLRKISSDAFKPSPVPNYPHFAQQASPSQRSSSKAGFKRQRTSDSQSEEPGARARRESEQDIYCMLCTSSQGNSSPVPSGDSPPLFTPPYTPTSSSSPLQQEELIRDPLVDVHECTDQPLSSPEPSPSYYSYPEAGLTCLQSPADSLPATAQQTFDQSDFDSLPESSPLSSLSEAYDLQPCSSDAQVVPDCYSGSEMCESAVECVSLDPEDFHLLEPPQGGSFGQLHHVPHQELPVHSSLLTPHQSPDPPELNHYNEREQEEISILAQQISSLASSFDMHHTLNLLQNTAQPAATNASPSPSDWCLSSVSSALLPKHQLVSDDRVFENILKELNMLARKNDPSCPDVISYSHQPGLGSRSHQSEHLELGLFAEDALTEVQFNTDCISMNPFGLQLGHHNQNTGLHQLNQYLQSSLQQDGLAEDNLY